MIPMKTGMMLSLFVIALVCLILILVFYASFSGDEDNPPLITENLMDVIDRADSVMWIGPHADDELWIAGTFGLLTKDKGFDGTIVAFGRKYSHLLGNTKSAAFFNCDYIRIADKLYPEQQNISFPDNNYIRCVELWLEDGTKDELVTILQEKQPDIIFSFEPESTYEVMPSHAASATIVSIALEEADLSCAHFFTIQTLQMTQDEENLEYFEVTDVIDLNTTLWEYKLEVVGFYKSVYPSFHRLLFDMEYQNSLVHKELFRCATTSTP